jgi:thioredoxin
MKKIIILTVLALSFGFISCSNIKGNQEKNNLKIENGDDQSKDNDAKPEHLTYETFLQKVWNFEKHPREWVYEGDVPCVIDFYADWCGPCKRVAPIMDEMAKKYKGKVKIYKINVDKERKLASVFQVRSIPSVLFSPVKGRPTMQVGLLPHDTYVKIIEQELLGNKPEKEENK